MNTFLLHHHLEFLLGLSLLLSFFEWGKRLLFPFQIFTTWVHECWHGLAAVLMGGSDIRITLSPDGSGLTEYRIPKSKLRQGFVASAGYLGSSATGCLIFFLTTQTVSPELNFSARSLVITLCALIIFSLVFWVRNVFGVICVALLAAAIAGLTYEPFYPYAKFVLIFLGIQTALNALFDIRQLFSVSSSRGVESDAHTMKKLFYLPAWIWAFLWLGLSVYLMFLTFKFAKPL